MAAFVGKRSPTKVVEIEYLLVRCFPLGKGRLLTHVLFWRRDLEIKGVLHVFTLRGPGRPSPAPPEAAPRGGRKELIKHHVQALIAKSSLTQRTW